MFEDSIYEPIRGFIVAKANPERGIVMGGLPLRDIGLYRRKHFKGNFVRMEERCDMGSDGCRNHGKRGLLLVERKYFQRRVFRDTKHGLIVGEQIDEYRSAFYHYDLEGKLVHVERRYFNYVRGWTESLIPELTDERNNRAEIRRPIAERAPFDLEWDSQGRLARVAGARFLYRIRYIENGRAAELDIHTMQFRGHKRSISASWRFMAFTPLRWSVERRREFAIARHPWRRPSCVAFIFQKEEHDERNIRDKAFNMLKNELQQAYLARLENRWLVDGCGGSFMKTVRRSTLPELRLASQDNPNPYCPLYLVFWVESLIDDGRFSEAPLAFPEGFLDGEYVRSRELLAELEGILKITLENRKMPTEYWIERAGRLDARQRAMALAQPRIASAVIPGAQFGFAYTGGFRTRLGTLLELWESKQTRPPCPHCGGKLLFFSAGALLSSGRAKGYCMNCKIVTTIPDGLALRLYCEAGKIEGARIKMNMPFSIGAAFRILEAKGDS